MGSTQQQLTVGVVACGHVMAPTSLTTLDGTRVRAAALAPFAGAVVVDAFVAPPPRGAPV